MYDPQQLFSFPWNYTRFPPDLHSPHTQRSIIDYYFLLDYLDRVDCGEGTDSNTLATIRWLETKLWLIIWKSTQIAEVAVSPGSVVHIWWTNIAANGMIYCMWHAWKSFRNLHSERVN